MNKRRKIVLLIILTMIILAGLAYAATLFFTFETNQNEKVPMNSYSFDDPSWWDHAVFYEIFVRSFYDSNGDGIGDFNGITEKLDYLNDGDPTTTTDLGINAIWLMPIFPSPSYHGYDVTDYYSVNPEYGTKEDFENFINEAHKRGIHVIIDFVINHTSDQNPWFVSALDPASSNHDWYIWSDTQLSYLGPWGEEVWHKAANGLYYYGIFTAQMPDLNYRNQAVTDEIETVAKFWLNDMNVDGFRVDGARHLIEDGETQANTPDTITWFKDFSKYFKGLKPSAMSIGEVWDASYSSTKYIQSESFDLVFDFDLASAIISGVKMGSASALNARIVSEIDIFKDKGMGTFLTNHDMDRVMSQFEEDSVMAGHAATILLTIPGTPFIYYGEEVGMVGQKPDEKIRTPMQWSGENAAGFSSATPWEGVNPSYSQSNVASQTDNPNSILSLYRNLIQLRLKHSAFLDGEYIIVTSSSPAIYAAISQSGDDILLTVINLKDQSVTAPTYKVVGGNLEGMYSIQPLLNSGETTSEIQVLKESYGSSFSFTQTIPAGYNQVYQLTLSK